MMRKKRDITQRKGARDLRFCYQGRRAADPKKHRRRKKEVLKSLVSITGDNHGTPMFGKEISEFGHYI